MLFGEYVCICCRLVTIEKRLLITKQTCELLTAAYSVVHSSSDGWEYESICPTTASFWKEVSVKKKKYDEAILIPHRLSREISELQARAAHGSSRDFCVIYFYIQRLTRLSQAWRV